MDLGLADAILEQRVRPDLDHFVAAAFEEAAQVYVAWLARDEHLAFIPERVGSWWDRESQIDVLAISQLEKAALIGECKWSINPVGVNVLENLKSKAQMLAGEKDLHQIYFALFSRSGFTQALEERAAKEGVRLVAVEQIVNQALG